MEFDDLTEEQMERARECKTPEDLVKLAEEEDLDLSDEQLEAISGGDTSAWSEMTGCDSLAAEPCPDACIGNSPVTPTPHRT